MTAELGQETAGAAAPEKPRSPEQIGMLIKALVEGGEAWQIPFLTTPSELQQATAANLGGINDLTPDK